MERVDGMVIESVEMVSVETETHNEAFQSLPSSTEPRTTNSTAEDSNNNLGTVAILQAPQQQIKYQTYLPVETVTQSRKPRIKKLNPAVFDDKSVASGGGYESSSNPSQSNYSASKPKPAKKRGPKPSSKSQVGMTSANTGDFQQVVKRPRGRPPLALKREPNLQSSTAAIEPAARLIEANRHTSAFSSNHSSSTKLPRPAWQVVLHRLLQVLSLHGPLSMLDLGRRLSGVPLEMVQGALEFLHVSCIVEEYRFKAAESSAGEQTVQHFLPTDGTAVYGLRKNAARVPPLMFQPAISDESGQGNDQLMFFLQRMACTGEGRDAERVELEQTTARLERLQQLEEQLHSVTDKNQRYRMLSDEIRAIVQHEPRLGQEPLYHSIVAALSSSEM